jgi:hypothetical protein
MAEITYDWGAERPSARRARLKQACASEAVRLAQADPRFGERLSRCAPKGSDLERKSRANPCDL